MSVKSTITNLTRKGQEVLVQAGRLQVQFGLILAEVDVLIREHGDRTGFKSIRAYIEDTYPDQVRPIYGSSAGYRALQAGRVAMILGDVGDASVDALQPLHKLIDDPAKVKAAYKAAKAGRRTSPTRAEVVDQLPEDTSGKAGPKAGSAKAANGAKAKAAKAGTTKVAAAPVAAAPVREVPNVTGSATKAAQLRLTKVQAACSDPAAFLTLATLVAKACDDIGSANVLAALQVMSSDAPKAAAAKPRNTRKSGGPVMRKARAQVAKVTK